MLSFLDWMKNWTEKSKELRKFWYCKIMAFCSSSDLRAKFKVEAIRIICKEPSFKIKTSSRISFIGMNSWVDLVVVAIFVYYSSYLMLCFMSRLQAKSFNLLLVSLGMYPGLTPLSACLKVSLSMEVGCWIFSFFQT